jgi:hypothetical protein
VEEEALTSRMSPLSIGPSMPVEVEKYMDGEIDEVFCLSL